MSVFSSILLSEYLRANFIIESPKYNVQIVLFLLSNLVVRQTLQQMTLAFITIANPKSLLSLMTR